MFIYCGSVTAIRSGKTKHKGIVAIAMEKRVESMTEYDELCEKITTETYKSDTAITDVLITGISLL